MDAPTVSQSGSDLVIGFMVGGVVAYSAGCLIREQDWTRPQRALAACFGTLATSFSISTAAQDPKLGVAVLIAAAIYKMASK